VFIECIVLVWFINMWLLLL